MQMSMSLINNAYVYIYIYIPMCVYRHASDLSTRIIHILIETHLRVDEIHSSEHKLHQTRLTDGPKIGTTHGYIPMFAKCPFWLHCVFFYQLLCHKKPVFSSSSLPSQTPRNALGERSPGRLAEIGYESGSK